MFSSRFQPCLNWVTHNAVTQQAARLYWNAQNGRQWQQHIARLGSINPEEAEHAAEWLLERPEKALPCLHRALRRSPAIACGAAGLLHRMGEPEAVRHVLLRAYQDEWFTPSMGQDKEQYKYDVNRRIGAEPIRQAIDAALEAAPDMSEERTCLQTLIVALSGLRALGAIAASHNLEALPIGPYSLTAANFGNRKANADDLSGHASTQNIALWERALNFGPANLQPNMQRHGSVPLLANMTGWIRAEAIRRLLSEHAPDPCLAVLTNALSSADGRVVRSAIDGLQCLGDRRALPALETIAFAAQHPLASFARRAIERMAGAEAEVLTLVRASREETNAEELLRAARSAADIKQAQEYKTLLHIHERNSPHT